MISFDTIFVTYKKYSDLSFSLGAYSAKTTNMLSPPAGRNVIELRVFVAHSFKFAS